ncbi:MAG TPA: hypothetical protein VFH50_12495 [Acidimicrobiales bacterium]|nr:hypothetical protein [Acidimicrobiales bacterium]
MPPAASPRSLRRQRAVIAGVAAVMAGAGIGVPLARHLTRARLVAPDRVPSYQVTYRVRNLAAGGGGIVSWERLTVRRPFVSADFDYASRPGPGVTARAGSLFTEDALYDVQQGALHPVSGRQPGPPGNDQDLATQLPELEDRGLVRPQDRSLTVAGRSCRVYRFSGPPSGPVAPFTGADHDDVCLDADGIELGEDWTYHGRLVETRRAVAVQVGPVPDPVPASTLRAAGRVRPGAGAPLAEPDPTASTFLPAPPLPAGFRPAGVERFAEPDPQSPQVILATSVVWAFTNGADVVSVEAGQSAPGQPPWDGEATRTRTVTLTRLGPAATAIRSDGAEVRVDLGAGRWIRVRGTVPVSGLVAYADTLSAPAVG